MKNAFVRGLLCACALMLALPAQAAIKVLATTSDWGSLVTELGGDKVNVYTATSPLQDVHHVEAKPSLDGARSLGRPHRRHRRRTRDRLAAGAAAAVRQRQVQPGAAGHTSKRCLHVRKLDVPRRSTARRATCIRSAIRTSSLDPRNIATVGHGACGAPRAGRPANAAHYQQRWRRLPGALAAGDRRGGRAGRAAQGRAGRRHHKDLTYLIRWLGLKEVAALEPKPGVPPSAASSREPGRQARRGTAEDDPAHAYQDPKAADWLAERPSVPVVAAAVHGRRHARSEGPVRPVRRHAASACWRLPDERAGRST